MKKNPNIRTFEEHLTKHRGAPGTPGREAFERKAEAFKIGVLIGEARREQGLTQKQLAERAGVSESYISRIENDASAMRLDTLLRIVQTGLGGEITVSMVFAPAAAPKTDKPKAPPVPMAMQRG